MCNDPVARCLYRPFLCTCAHICPKIVSHWPKKLVHKQQNGISWHLQHETASLWIRRLRLLFDCIGHFDRHDIEQSSKDSSITAVQNLPQLCLRAKGQVTHLTTQKDGWIIWSRKRSCHKKTEGCSSNLDLQRGIVADGAASIERLAVLARNSETKILQYCSTN